MYSTARKMSLLCAILSAVNIMGVFLYLLSSAALSIPFSAGLAIFMILVASAGVSLMLTIALRSICQDLEYEYEDHIRRSSELSKRIEVLENQN